MQKCRHAGLVLGFLVLGGGIALGQARLGLHVVDGNDQKVGYVLDASNAVVFIDGEAYAVEAGQDGFRGVNYLSYSAAADCSDPQYVELYSGQGFGLFTAAWFTTDGVFHYAKTALAAPVPVQSVRTVVGDGSLGPCGGLVGVILGSPALSAPAPAFTPPFRVVDALAVSQAPATPTFNDVPTSHPFFQFIEALKASGITGGCQASPPLYCPDAPLTRGQMAVFLAKALGL